MIIILSVIGYIGINIFLQTTQINTGLLNAFGSSYNTTLQVIIILLLLLILVLLLLLILALLLLLPLPQGVAPISSDMFHVYLHLLSSPGVWLYTTLTLVVALLPDVVIRSPLLKSLLSLLLLQGAEKTLGHHSSGASPPQERSKKENQERIL